MGRWRDPQEGGQWNVAEESVEETKVGEAERCVPRLVWEFGFANEYACSIRRRSASLQGELDEDQREDDCVAARDEYTEVSSNFNIALALGDCMGKEF